MLISNDGKVITAANVVQTAESVTVEFWGGEAIPADVITSNPRADVALLQLREVPDHINFAKIGNSDNMQTGDPVFVVGAPYDMEHTLFVGYLSARRRPDFFKYLLTNLEVFQTDAAINAGNSGGPMFNMSGEIIGIVSYNISESGGSDGLGFATTSNVMRDILFNRKYFWSGIGGRILHGQMAKLLNLPQSRGFLVQRIATNSPAEKLGLRPGHTMAEIEGEDAILLGGDIILEINGISLAETLRQLRRNLGKSKRLAPGDEFKGKVLREGKIISLSTIIPQ